MNNEQRTFESFLDEVAVEWDFDNYKDYQENSPSGGDIEFFTQAAQRFAAWMKEQGACNAIINLPVEDIKRWFQLLVGIGEEAMRADIKSGYTFSGLPVEQGQKADGWISVRDRLPTESDADENGKVLIYRTLNDHQKPLSKSIHDWNMVKHCEDDTLWQSLPAIPLQVNKDQK